MKVDGMKIDIAIAKKGLKRSEFCRKNDLLPQTVLRVIRTNVASTLTAVRIAEGLGVGVKEILLTENLEAVNI